ncbi:MAG TPA: DUF1080 domain-containing protein [Opitutaceae bacterium]|nr:DUF1080 domain-containing protein [Opitutaceae bacterium]
MRRLVLLLAGMAASTVACAADLWSGRDLTGWEFVTTPTVDITSVCHVNDGVMAAAGRPIGYLATTAVFANYRLHVEWRWPGKPGNGGVLVHISSGPKDRQWPLCFQIQLKAHRAGDILPMAGARCAELPSPTATQVDKKGVDSEKPAGEWNSCDIVCRDETIECAVNGMPQNRVTACTPATGRIGFQFEGAPFELRHLRLTPIP